MTLKTSSDSSVCALRTALSTSPVRSLFATPVTESSALNYTPDVTDSNTVSPQNDKISVHTSYRVHRKAERYLPNPKNE